MKILILSQYFWPESFRVNDIAKGLLESGHDVTILTGIPNYPKGEPFSGYRWFLPMREQCEGMTVYRVPLYPRGAGRSLSLVLNYLSFMFFASILAPFLLLGKKFDRIFVYQVSPVTVIFPAILLKFLKRAKLYVWVLDLWPDSLEATRTIQNKFLLGIVDNFVRFLYFFSDKILVSSKGFLDKIEAQGVNRSKMLYWPQWGEELKVPTDFPKREEVGMPADGFVILFAGNIGTSQDFETIIEAAKLTRSDDALKWVIVGDGRMKGWVEDQVRINSLEESVFLLGRKPIEEMPVYYGLSDCLLISLKDEPIFSLTLPAKTQSCLSSAKPILASINGETANLVDGEQCGLSCPASSPRELAETAIKLSKKSGDELRDMGHRGKKFFESNFTRDDLLQKLIAVMEK